jgi:N-hydroxyarylamine O-acetyltransferase
LNLALKALGFDVRPLTARVHYGRTGPGARTHEVLIVTISGREWLADCGFGGPGLRLPMPAVPDRVEEHFGARYRLRHDPRYGAVLQKESAGVFVDLYSYNVHELTLDIDLEMANHFTSTWPSSIFRLSRMCALPKPWGRVTLSDMELAIHNAEEVVRRILPPGPAYLEAVTEHFGLRLDARYEDLAPLKPIS